MPSKLRFCVPGRAALVALGLAALAVFPPAAPAAADPEEAHYNTVVNLYNAGQWQAALAKIDEREKQTLSDTMRARYLFARGLALEKGGQPAEARAVYQRLLKDHPDASESARALLAMVYIAHAARDAKAVIEDSGRLDQAKLAAADRRNVALMRAEAFYALKNDAEARTAFEQALALGADRGPIEAKLFELNYRAGRFEELVATAATNLAGIAPDRAALIRAESMLGLNKPADAVAEADKIAAGKPEYPRACLIKAQALIKLGRLKDALEPLQTAVSELRDPPAPPTARLALVECLMENNRAAEAQKAMAAAEKTGASLPAEERQAFSAQCALIKLRLVDKAGSARDIVRAVNDVQANLPPAVLAEALYMRAHALFREQDWRELAKVFAADYPRLQGTPREGPATLIFAEALGRQKQAAVRKELLEGYLERQPKTEDAQRARLALANGALETGDDQAARNRFKELLAAAEAQKVLGADAWRDIARNAVALALKAGDTADVIAIAKPLAAGSAPDSRLLVMLGQAYAVNKQWAEAVAVWKQVLPSLSGPEAADIRERLAQSMFAARDFKGAREQLQELATNKVDAAVLSRELRELWARASFNLNDYPDAAARYQSLADAFRDTPAYAYESAVAYERAGKWAEAAGGYAAAAKAVEKLPPDYAAVVEDNLARARLEAGIEDRGAAIWLTRLAPAVSNAQFDLAAVMLGRALTESKPDAIKSSPLRQAMQAYPADEHRHYTCGALWLQALAARGDSSLAEEAARLADDYSANEKKLPAGSSGATIAPAMIYYYRGEAARRARQPAKALSDFETVLAAYPYNEWPDAAAYGAAMCFAELDDLKTARARLTELVNSSAAKSAASAAWREKARERLTTLPKEEKP